MTDVRLHPNTNLLLDYSSGGLSPAQAIAISAHLFYCPHCQAKAGTLNEIGGSLLADGQPISVSSSCRASVMSLLDAADDGEVSLRVCPSFLTSDVKIVFYRFVHNVFPDFFLCSGY